VVFLSLPGTLTPASPRSRRRSFSGSNALLRKIISHSDGHSVVAGSGDNKKAGHTGDRLDRKRIDYPLGRGAATRFAVRSTYVTGLNAVYLHLSSTSPCVLPTELCKTLYELVCLSTKCIITDRTDVCQPAEGNFLCGGGRCIWAKREME
jgi:hypothetical protein